MYSDVRILSRNYKRHHLGQSQWSDVWPLELYLRRAVPFLCAAARLRRSVLPREKGTRELWPL